MASTLDPAGLVLRELAPGVTVEQVVQATAARLVISDSLTPMRIA